MNKVYVESTQVNDKDEEISCKCEVLSINLDKNEIVIEYPDGEVQTDELESYFDDIFKIKDDEITTFFKEHFGINPSEHELGYLNALIDENGSEFTSCEDYFEYLLDNVDFLLKGDKILYTDADKQYVIDLEIDIDGYYNLFELVEGERVLVDGFVHLSDAFYNNSMSTRSVNKDR